MTKYNTIVYNSYDKNATQERHMKTDSKQYELLKLQNQLCFPLYAAARQITSKYNPYFKPLDLTYAEYITFMVLWEQDGITVGELGQKLYLNNSTITPVLKKMELGGYIKRERKAGDERIVVISLTKAGRDMQEKCLHIPQEVGKCVAMPKEKLMQLHDLLYELIENIQRN